MIIYVLSTVVLALFFYASWSIANIERKRANFPNEAKVHSPALILPAAKRTNPRVEVEADAQFFTNLSEDNNYVMAQQIQNRGGNSESASGGIYQKADKRRSSSPEVTARKSVVINLANYQRKAS